mgnify:FL=1
MNCEKCKTELNAEDYFLSVHNVCKNCINKNYKDFIKRGL